MHEFDSLTWPWIEIVVQQDFEDSFSQFLLNSEEIKEKNKVNLPD
jgi:hypothetical protein